MYEKPTGLTISGGSIKGIGALGVLYCIRERLTNLKYFSGTSIGALIVTLVACDIPIFDIFSYVYLHDDLVEIFLHTTSIAKLIDRLTNDMGLLKIYESFTYKIEDFILEKTGWTEIPTLLEFYERTGKTLLLVSTREINNTFKIEVLTYKTFPNLSILKAIEMSANIPWVFCKLKEGDYFYIDGAFSNDFPFNLLKEEMLTSETSLGSEGRVSEIISILMQGSGESTPNPISFTHQLISHPILLLSLKEIESMTQKEKENNIILSMEITNPVDFNLNKRVKMDYFISGHSLALSKI